MYRDEKLLRRTSFALEKAARKARYDARCPCHHGEHAVDAVGRDLQ
jgi:hypothetical protein